MREMDRNSQKRTGMETWMVREWTPGTKIDESRHIDAQTNLIGSTRILRPSRTRPRQCLHTPGMGWWPWSGSEQDEAKAKWEAEPWGEYYGSFPGAYCIDNRKPPTEWSKAKLMAKTTAKQQDVAVQDQGFRPLCEPEPPDR